MQPVGIFRQAAIAGLAVTKDLFDVPERMFHLGPGTGFELFGSQLTLVQILPSAGTLGNEPGDVFAILMLIALLNPKITGITENSFFVTMEKVSSGYDVVNVGRFRSWWDSVLK